MTQRPQKKQPQKPVAGDLQQKIAQLEELNRILLGFLVAMLKAQPSESIPVFSVDPAQAQTLASLSDAEINQLAKCGRSLFNLPMSKGEGRPSAGHEMQKLQDFCLMLFMLAAEITRAHPVASVWMLGIAPPQVEKLSSFSVIDIQQHVRAGTFSVSLVIPPIKHFRPFGETTILSKREK